MMIKKCPFCSGDAEIIYDDGFEITCSTCSLIFAPFIGTKSDDKTNLYWLGIIAP